MRPAEIAEQAARNSRRVVWMGRYMAHAFRSTVDGAVKQAACGVYADPRDELMSRRHGVVCPRCPGIVSRWPAR